MDWAESLLNGAIVETLGWALLHFLWQGLVVVVGFALAMLGLRGASANVRYVAGCVALVVLLILPVATVAWLSREPAGVAVVLSVPEGTGAHEAEAMASGALRPAGLSTRNPFRTLASEEAPEVAIESPAVRIGYGLQRALPWIVLVWALGVFGFSARLAGGWWSLKRLVRRDAHPLPDPWPDRFHRLRKRMGFGPAVRLLQSGRARVPCAVGWWRPVVLLPVSLITNLSPSQLEAILLHELAHIRRRDYLVNLLQCAAETLLFYHPAVWWISRRVRTEREHCCDDLVVGVSGDAPAYARALADVASLCAGESGSQPIAAPAATEGRLVTRIRRILVPGAAEPAGPSGWILGLFSLALFAALGIGIRVASQAAQPPRADAILGASAVVETGSTESIPPSTAPTLLDAPDVAEIPAELVTLKINPNLRYALIGGGEAPPADGYRLLVVLPGGDGGPDFHPFVKRIRKFALNDRYLVAQLIAPEWSPGQFERLVWPTEGNPWPAMPISTEAFIEETIRDVKTHYPVDERYVFTLGWSSGGPPVYAEALNPRRSITGSFVAMSVFKPDKLPPLEEARGHAIFLLYSPDDFIPRWMPERARDLLRQHGAQIQTLTYTGGHGWHGDVYGNIRTGIEWLEGRQNPFRE